MKWAARGITLILVSLLPVSWAGEQMIPTVMPIALAGGVLYLLGFIVDLLTARRNKVDERRGVLGLVNWMLGRGHIDDYAPGTRREVQISLAAVPLVLCLHLLIVAGRIAT